MEVLGGQGRFYRLNQVVKGHSVVQSGSILIFVRVSLVLAMFFLILCL